MLVWELVVAYKNISCWKHKGIKWVSLLVFKDVQRWCECANISRHEDVAEEILDSLHWIVLEHWISLNHVWSLRHRRQQHMEHWRSVTPSLRCCSPSLVSPGKSGWEKSTWPCHHAIILAVTFQKGSILSGWNTLSKKGSPSSRMWRLLWAKHHKSKSEVLCFSISKP